MVPKVNRSLQCCRANQRNNHLYPPLSSEKSSLSVFHQKSSKPGELTSWHRLVIVLCSSKSLLRLLTNLPFRTTELNALFSINPELLHRKVHPVIHSIHSKPDRTKPLRVRPRHLSLPARSEQAEQCSSARNSADSRESGHRSDAFRF